MPSGHHRQSVNPRVDSATSPLRYAVLVLLVLGGLSLAAVLPAGCGPDSESQETASPADTPRSGGTLRTFISEPTAIDPLNLRESEGTHVGRTLFDSLLCFDHAAQTLVPAVAEAWETNGNATVWTFHLRRGTTFHNGREVTAQDFKYAWERICNPINESTIAYHLAAVEGYDDMVSGAARELSGIRVVDDYTLRVTLSRPFGDFDYVVAHPALGPVPKEEVEKDPQAYAEAPIGNGPFRMAEPWKHSEYVKVVRFDEYYGGSPYVDGVDFLIFPDPTTAFMEFKAGNLDYTAIIPGQWETVVAEYGASEDGYTVSPGHQALGGPAMGTEYLLFNGDDPILQNADVRRALSLATNREALSEVFYQGMHEPASSIIPPSIVGYESNAWPYSRHDPAQARELLAAAGYPEGEGLPELELLYVRGAGLDEALQLIQADFEAINVGTKLDGFDWATYVTKIDERQFQLAAIGWLADYPIIDNFVFPLFSSMGGDNASGYRNPAVDEAISVARSITDPGARVEAYQEIVRTIGEDAPVSPLKAYSLYHVASARVEGLTCSPQGTLNLGCCWLAERE